MRFSHIVSWTRIESVANKMDRAVVELGKMPPSSFFSKESTKSISATLLVVDRLNLIQLANQTGAQLQRLWAGCQSIARPIEAVENKVNNTSIATPDRHCRRRQGEGKKEKETFPREAIRSMDPNHQTLSSTLRERERLELKSQEFDTRVYILNDQKGRRYIFKVDRGSRAGNSFYHQRPKKFLGPSSVLS